MASWLHLSDLHVLEEPDKEALLRSFKRLSERIRHPDFMIVTGDFQDKKAETDFTFAEAYLNEILSFFGVTKENAYLVPGNHDTNEATPSERKIIKSVTKDIANHYFCYDEHLKKLSTCAVKYAIKNRWQGPFFPLRRYATPSPPCGGGRKPDISGKIITFFMSAVLRSPPRRWGGWRIAPGGEPSL